MNLKDGKQQNIQKQLDFPPALTGEAREASRKSGLVDSINGRVEAISRILQTVQKAKAEGQDITAALRSMMPLGTNLALLPPDSLRDWIIAFAGELSRFPARRDARLSQLEQLPKPPTFYRR